MCRLFALISKKQENPEYWFFKSKVPFKLFSEKIINKGPHDSGWGIGWLENGIWQIFKEGKDSVKKYSFDKVKEVKSNIILIHLRHASVGPESTINAHPFVYNKFIFEHNGSIEKESVKNYLNENFKKQIKSETDSEIYFLLIMQFYEETKNIIESIKKSLDIIKKYPHKGLNFILSEGKNLYVFRGASKNVRDLYDYYCLNYLIKDNDIIVSSDPLSDDKWVPIKLNELVIINPNLKIEKLKL